MLVGAIAGVEDAGQEMGSTGSAVANDNDVNVQRFEVARCVFECFALLEGGCLGVEIDDVSRKPLLGKLKAGARTGGGLDKQVHDGLAAQGGDLLDGALADRFESAGGVEHGDDFLNREGFDVEQMFALPAHRGEGSIGLVDWWTNRKEVGFGRPSLHVP